MTFEALLTFCFLLFLFNDEVWGYYCEWDLCGSDQYCCGDNLCCDYVYSLWYFWVGVLFVVILLSACGGLFRYCYYNDAHLVSYRLPTYSPLPNDSDNFVIFEREAPVNVYSDHKLVGYGPPRDPPPPYSATVSNSSTLSSSSSFGAEHHNNKLVLDGNLYVYP